MGYAVLKITDGTDSVSLIGPGTGYRLQDWRPAIVEPKGGGVWSDSPLADGRRLSMTRWSTAIETFDLALNGYNQEAVIAEARALRRLLEKARLYWTAAYVPGPVWIEARADCETNSRYAAILDYRTPEDDNPYGTGFSGALPLMSGLTLAVERGHWLSSPPGQGECLPTSDQTAGYTYGPNLIANNSFETAGGGGADVFASWTETAGDGSIARTFGSAYVGSYRAVLTSGATLNTAIQQNVAVTAGATYVLTFYFIGVGRYQVTNVTAGGDIIPLSTFDPLGVSPDWKKGSVQFTVPGGCNTVGIILRCYSSAGSSLSYDYVTLRRITAATFGRAATCAPETFFANCRQSAQITDAYYYDDSAGTFSSNMVGAATPHDLLPAAPAVNDILYIGVDDGALINGPFFNVVFDLLQSGAGYIEGTIQRWSSAAWGSLYLANDNTSDSALSASSHLAVSGVAVITWHGGNGWTKTTVNGVYGYWMRIIITAVVGGVPRPRQQNRGLYSVTRPFMGAAASAVGGDLRALARHELRSESAKYFKHFLVYSRSLARGARWSPFINFSEVQPEPEIVLYGYSLSTLVEDADSSAGWAIESTPAFPYPSSVQIILDIGSPLCNDYHGKYRAFLRVRHTAGTAGQFSVSLTVTSASTITSEVVKTTAVSATNFELLDMGKVTIPSVELGAAVDVDSIRFAITIVASAGGNTLRTYDLILIPIDESVVEITPDGSTSHSVGVDNYALVDSIYPRRMVRSFLADSAGVVWADSPLYAITSGPATLKNGEAQAVGVLVMDYPPGVLRLDTDHADRYLSMRGDQ